MPNIKDSMAAGHKMVHDANLQSFSTRIGCKMANSAKDMQKTLAMATVGHPQMLIGRQQTILFLRANAERLSDKWDRTFARLANIESEVAPFFQGSGKDKDSLEVDAIAQLSFQHELFNHLNHVPWLLFVVSIFKIWVVPTMSILLPILVWILPYFLLRFVYGLPITQEQYMQILQHIMAGNLVIPDMDAVPADRPFTIQSAVQLAMFAFTLIQSMIQPIQNAMHLYKTDEVCVKIGAQILEIRTAIRELRGDIGPMNGIHVKLSYSLEHLDEADRRMAFISIQDCPENIHMIFRDLAHLECMWRIANSPDLNPVVFSRGVLKLEDAFDISLGGVQLVKSSLSLQEKPHAILTGPNGGGKSSFLRSVLQSVLIGHAFGFAPAKEAYMPRFNWIACGLQLRDTPGKLSMFETEVQFAAETIRAAKQNGPGLVLFDELFHSTNPADSSRTAVQFLRRLWKQNDIFTVVSTHIFPLVATAPDHVQAICCPATQGENGEIHFGYKIEPGICEISSVHTVWEKFGLVPKPNALSKSPANSK
jgi:hypothetical protein